jgi:diguanylate cyclase (GGDEF)-like protein
LVLFREGVRFYGPGSERIPAERVFNLKGRRRKMKVKYANSIVFRAMFFYMMLSLITVSFVVFIIFENQMDLISKNTRLEAEQQFSALIGAIRKASYETSRGALFERGEGNRVASSFLEMVKPYADSYMIITDSGRILHRSSQDVQAPSTMGEDTLKLMTVREFSGSEFFLRMDEENRLMYCYIPLGDDEKPKTETNILLIVRKIKMLDEALRNLYRQALFVIMVVVFFHSVFAVALYRQILNPVRILQEGARKIAQGEFDYRIVMRGSVKEFVSLSESFNSMAETVGGNMGKLAVEVEESRKKLKKADILSVRDEVTELPARPYLLERLKEEMNLSGRTEGFFTLALIEIDGFRGLFSIYGASTVNIILFETAKLISRICGESGLVCRFGDASFAVLFPGAESDQARARCETAVMKISEKAIVTPDGGFTVTVSVGLCAADRSRLQAGDDENSLLAAAEASLSRARSAGGNRIES